MGCGSGYLFSGNYYWTQVELDWRFVEHHRASLMLCGYSASPEEHQKQKQIGCVSISEYFNSIHFECDPVHSELETRCKF